MGGPFGRHGLLPATDRGAVIGVECDHLAFRNADTDWQIWIESGAKPIPRKYVITSKGIASVEGPVSANLALARRSVD
jgi:hypothetical protein